MGFVRDMTGRFWIAGELLSFFWINKLWWMIPMILVLLAVGLLVFIGETSPVGPFIYTLF